MALTTCRVYTYLMKHVGASVGYSDVPKSSCIFLYVSFRI